MTVSMPVGAMRLATSLMSFSSGWPMPPVKPMTFTPCSIITFAMVRESRPPETQVPATIPLRSSKTNAMMSLHVGVEKRALV